MEVVLKTRTGHRPLKRTHPRRHVPNELIDSALALRLGQTDALSLLMTAPVSS